MIVVGITGGIGSGKSTVSTMLAALGAVVVDADKIVHELQQPGAPLLDVLAERFGPDIIDGSGALDRARLAAIAFTDDTALRDLNDIVHPATRAELVVRVAANAGTDNVVVLDVPLVTDPRRDGMQALIVVDAPLDVAVERLVAQRGMSEADSRARIDKQISRDERIALADRVIDNSGDRDALERQVTDTWAWICSLDPVPAPDLVTQVPDAETVRDQNADRDGA